MSQKEPDKKSAADEIDVYVERNAYKIKLHVRAVLAERKVSLHDLLTMQDKQFERIQDWLHEKRVPVREIKALYNFRYADDSPIFKKRPSSSGRKLNPVTIEKKGEEEMKIGDLPAGERKLQQRVLGRIGELSVIDVDQAGTNVMFDGREIRIPTETVCGQNGKWGTLYGVGFAKYVDDGKSIPKEVTQELQRQIAAAYGEKGYHAEFK
jgi:hypothetical protein